MFQILAPLLRQRAVGITVAHTANTEDHFTLLVIPMKINEGENDAVQTPFELKGPAAYIDEQLPVQLKEFVNNHLVMTSTLAEASATMAAAAKTATDNANKKKKAAASTTPAKATTAAVVTEPAKPEPPKPPAAPSLFDAAPATEPATTAVALPPEAVPAAGEPVPAAPVLTAADVHPVALDGDGAVTA